MNTKYIKLNENKKKRNRYSQRVGLPFVERFQLGVVLQAALVDEELHPLEEGRRDGGRLLAEQHVNRLRGGNTQLARFARVASAALGVFAVHKAIYKKG